jgi:demethylmenaquinone methyltransferase/2-methoxy-6-polyprenyl-1,4-benzoquinol methylase
MLGASPEARISSIASPMSETVKQMFGRIAPTYDLANRVLSARRDVAWRRNALDLLQGAPGDCLDLACGTFDFALEALARQRARRIHGCDFSLPMLQAGAAKRAGRPLSATTGDALRLPYASGAFDTAMVAYGWRNFGDPAAALTELARVLRPGGELLILEFFRPVRLWPRLFYGTFGRVMMPLVGGLVSGDRAAYSYLNKSISSFLSIDEAEALLGAAGFSGMRRLACFGGVSHALAGTKGAAGP